MNFLNDVRPLFLRLVRYTMRMPVFMVIGVVQSILWLVLFGQLFQRVAQIPGFESDSYLQFLAPGITIMTALFGSAHSGMGTLVDIERGVMDRLLATPARRGALMAARVLHAGLLVVFQGAVILGVSLLMGARPGAGGLGLLVVLVATGLLGCAFGALSNAIALIARRQETVLAAMNFIILPLTFLSGIMMSATLMPGWIQRVAALNPANWAVLAARAGFEGQNWGAVGLNLVWLTLFALACGWLATRAFDRYRRTI
jgi:ABC-2 type transport system permease protein